jgi:hypothetical protein
LELKVNYLHDLIKRLRDEKFDTLNISFKLMTRSKVSYYETVSLKKYERMCKLLKSQNEKLRNSLENNSRIAELLESTEDELYIIKQGEKYEKLKSDIIRSPDRIQEKLLSCMESLKLKEESLAKISRQMKSGNEEKRILKAENDRLTECYNDIEAYVSQFETQVISEKSEFEKRIVELELIISTFEKERKDLMETSVNVKDYKLDTSLPIGQQLEEALNLINQRGKIIDALETKCRILQEQESQSKEVVRASKEAISIKDKKMAKIEYQLSEAVKSKQDGFNGETIPSIDKSSERETAALKFARHTIESLQKQIKMKEEMIARYRSMLKKSRQEAALEREMDMKKISEKDETINALTQRELNRFQREPEVNPRLEYEVEMQRSEALESEILAKNQAILELQEKIQATQKKEHDYQKSVEDLQSIIIEREQMISNLVSNFYNRA